MAFSYEKSTAFRLSQAAKILRLRAGDHLEGLGLHPGQESVLKALQENDGQTMSELAGALGVRPPTVTKMINRLGANDLVRREASPADGRLSRAYLTEAGRECATEIDRNMRALEREAMAGVPSKEKKKLKKLLKQIEENLHAAVNAEAEAGSAKAKPKAKPKKVAAE